ncbi:hypothetical protein [Roseateles sp. P5_E1]
MSLATVNAALEVVALLNEASDYQCTFELIELRTGASLEEALVQHFASIAAESHATADSGFEWEIKASKLGSNAAELLAPVLMHWAFGNHFSPSLGVGREWVQRNVASALCSHILDVVGEVEVTEVRTIPPVWYAAFWQDIALSSDRGRWLLHLAATD